MHDTSLLNSKNGLSDSGAVVRAADGLPVREPDPEGMPGIIKVTGLTEHLVSADTKDTQSIPGEPTGLPGKPLWTDQLDPQRVGKQQTAVVWKRSA